MRKSDIVFLACIFSLIVYWILSIIIGNLNSLIVALYNWIIETALVLGYPGALIVSLFGNATILFPFPYIGLPFILGGLRDLDSGTLWSGMIDDVRIYNRVITP